MGAGHSHRASRHADRLEVARGPRLTLLGALALAGIATVIGLVVLWPSGSDVDAVTSKVDFAAPGVTFPTADVKAVQPACSGDQSGGGSGGSSGSDCGSIRVTVAEGAGQGDTVTVSVPPQISDSGLTVGDTVVVQRTPVDGADPSYAYFGTSRTTPLLVLLAAFVVVVVAVARWRGVFALVGVVFSGAVLWWFALPALLVGSSGLAVGLTAAAAILFVVLYTTHGFSVRTSTALAGTFAGVLVTAGLGVVGTQATRLVGVSDESAGVLSGMVGQLDFAGLFAAALVVAGIGVLNDVTITQASSVWEIRAAAPQMTRRQVFASGMRIGRDHIASTIYTIVFVYAGTALAVLLVLRLYGLPFEVLLATEDITQEVVRTLASSIGLVLAVPLTTGIAALVVPGASGRDDLPE
ncbi:YibE/F family protein [Nocardioides mangrovi]|uniref:YibE/F family protein n=1 Tax=Nocardioides mangrovi TaxID=2874580 RepID=A0ABS7UB69_9ACTN|nr:YibE/F family protein [Nocardioides mangrovi]MBZ5738127.1 YibE/F family protein [Nocardioides mangrovi]